MGQSVLRATFACLLALTAAPSLANPAGASATVAPVELHRHAAAEARQGIAVDRDHAYVNDNSAIGKYDKRTGRKVASWAGDPAQFIHMNSCVVIRRQLVCAASNYPATPMISSVEWFDTRTMRHVASRSLGPAYGSLTWLDWHQGHWWAMFAHYDGRGGEPGRDHRYSVLVRYDRAFAETGVWRLPDSVLAQMAPYSSSGGSWGGDGLLYMTGHDRREAYALRLPTAGSTLVHVATVPFASPGQAIAWDRYEPALLWSIDRSTRQFIGARMPPIAGAQTP